MVGEEKRHQMMQNLFGDQSEEEEEEEEEIDSEHESNRHPSYASDEAEVRVEPEAEVEVEGQGEAEVGTEGELHDGDHDQGESDGERGRSSQEEVVGDQKFESGGRESESDEGEEYGRRIATSKRRDAIQSGSESEQNYADNLDEEVNQTARPRSPDEEEDATNYAELAPEIRDVFGDESDEEEPAEYGVQKQNEEDSNRSPTEEEDNYEKLRPEDILADEEERYDSEEEHVEIKVKEKPVGPPLELEIPFRHPPATADRLNMIKVSNIMGIDPKPFDPKTYVEEENFVTDDSGSRRRIRLENNIVRWRKVRNMDGSTSVESNARFVRWSDGSLQLLIGNEVLDISIQDAQHDQSHLFLRHGKGILQSQGKILKKMRFMPSSLTSNSHRMLTALVDSRHKKVYKVKNCVTDMDPEREKEQKEKAASQTIKATELLNKKKEKVKHKYNLPPTTRKERELSPGFLDDDDEGDYESRRPTSRRHFDDFEMEVRAEKRIINAKKGHKDISRKSSFPMGSSSRRPVDDYYESDMEESEYETEGEEEEEKSAPARRRAREEEEEEPEYEDEEEEAEEEENVNEPSEDEDEEPVQKSKTHGSSLKRKEIESEEDSPPRKMAPHRRMAIVYDSDED